MSSHRTNTKEIRVVSTLEMLLFRSETEQVKKNEKKKLIEQIMKKKISILFSQARKKSKFSLRRPTKTRTHSVEIVIEAIAQ